MSFEVPHIGPVSILDSINLRSGTWIGLLNCHKSPPHLVFVDDGFIYSLEHGSNRKYESDRLFKLIQQKKKPSIFFQLNVDTQGTTNRAFSAYSQLKSGQTCLNPIIDVLSGLGIEKIRNCEYIYQLIPELKAQGLLNEINGHLVITNPSNNHFYFQIYTKKEIFERIEKLKRTID